MYSMSSLKFVFSSPDSPNKSDTWYMYLDTQY